MPAPTTSLNGAPPPPPPQKVLPPITTIATPLTVSTDLKLIGINLFLALLLAALLALPAELINATLRENYGEITSWLGVSKGKLSGWHNVLHRLPTHFALAFFVVIAGVLYTFLDPAAGFNSTTYAELIGLVGALIVLTVIHDIARSEYVRHRFHHRGRLITFPAGILFAVGLVIVSRIFNFEPGFIFGLTTGIAFSDTLSDREDGHSLFVTSLFVLGVAFAAWFIWIPVKGSVDSTKDPAFIMVALDTLLATIWVAGIQLIVFSLIPIKFMDGEKVVHWNRFAWLGLYVFAIFVFVHTVLHPTDSSLGAGANSSVLYLAVLLGVLTVFAIGLWSFFFFHNRRKERLDKEPAAL